MKPYAIQARKFIVSALIIAVMMTLTVGSAFAQPGPRDPENPPTVPGNPGENLPNGGENIPEVPGENLPNGGENIPEVPGENLPNGGENLPNGGANIPEDWGENLPLNAEERQALADALSERELEADPENIAIAIAALQDVDTDVIAEVQQLINEGVEPERAAEIAAAIEAGDLHFEGETISAIIDYLEANGTLADSAAVAAVQEALEAYGPDLTEEQIAEIQAWLELNDALNDEQRDLLAEQLATIDFVPTGENLEVLLAGGQLTLNDEQIDFIMEVIEAGDYDLTPAQLRLIEQYLAVLNVSLTPEQIEAIESVIANLPDASV